MLKVRPIFRDYNMQTTPFVGILTKKGGLHTGKTERGVIY